FVYGPMFVLASQLRRSIKSGNAIVWNAPIRAGIAEPGEYKTAMPATKVIKNFEFPFCRPRLRQQLEYLTLSSSSAFSGRSIQVAGHIDDEFALRIRAINAITFRAKLIDFPKFPVIWAATNQFK